MQRAKAFFAFVLFALSVLGIALAIVPVKPYTFSASTQAKSAQVNADFDTLYSVLNAGLDYTNMNATNGIGANYIAATCGACTGAFQNGAYTFNAGAGTNTPLTVNAGNSQSVDILDTFNASGVKVTWIDKNDILEMTTSPLVNGSPILTGVSAPLTNTSGTIGLGTVGTANGGTGTTSYTTTRCLRTSSATTFASASSDCLTGYTSAGAASAWKIIPINTTMTIAHNAVNQVATVSVGQTLPSFNYFVNCAEDYNATNGGVGGNGIVGTTAGTAALAISTDEHTTTNFRLTIQTGDGNGASSAQTFYISCYVISQ